MTEEEILLHALAFNKAAQKVVERARTADLSIEDKANLAIQATVLGAISDAYRELAK